MLSDLALRAGVKGAWGLGSRFRAYRAKDSGGFYG